MIRLGLDAKARGWPGEWDWRRGGERASAFRFRAGVRRPRELSWVRGKDFRSLDASTPWIERARQRIRGLLRSGPPPLGSSYRQPAPPIMRESSPTPVRRPIPVDPDCLRYVLPLVAVGVLGWFFGPGPWIAVLAGAGAIAVLLFFRDPPRRGPEIPGAIWSPADGKVVAVEPNEDSERGPVPGVTIAIFLSVLDVHVNRAPCAGVVRAVRYRRGKFLDARHPECGVKNESNAVHMEIEDGREVVVRQIAGLIARRIVCRAGQGRRLARGERFGLIRFGSRTELYLPPEAQVRVSPGDRVAGGRTLVAVLPALAETGGG